MDRNTEAITEAMSVCHQRCITLEHINSSVTGI